MRPTLRQAYESAILALSVAEAGRSRRAVAVAALVTLSPMKVLGSFGTAVLAAGAAPLRAAVS